MDRLIPPPDAFGLPAPWWLLLGLLNLTFLIHLAFMNFVLGGSIVQAIALCLPRLRLRAKRDSASAEAETNNTGNLVIRVIAVMWPVALSFTITTGVAPLLFVQVLYGQFFYASTILIGATWLSILAFLLAAFYLGYALQSMLKRETWGRAWRAGVAISIALSVLAVAYLLTANAVLMIEPARWWDVRTELEHPLNPWRGTLLPRYIHNVVTASVVTGLWIVWAARLRRDLSPVDREALVRLGMRIGAWSAAVSSAIGVWYYFAMAPVAQRSLHSYGKWCGVGWLTGVLFALLAMVAMFRGARQPTVWRWTNWATGLSVMALAGMVLGREGLRIAALTGPTDAGSPAFEFGRFATYPQVSPILVFFPLLVGGLGVVGLMLWWYRAAAGQRGVQSDERGSQVRQP